MTGWFGRLHERGGGFQADKGICTGPRGREGNCQVKKRENTSLSSAMEHASPRDVQKKGPVIERGMNTGTSRIEGKF